MTALATTTRESAATLIATTGRTVHSIAPKVPVPPCVVVLPDEAWIIPERIGSSKHYALNLKALCVARDNDEGVTELEEAVEDVMGALVGFANIRSVSSPQSTDIGAQGSVLVAEVAFTAHVKE